jgi:hypothetical protein
MAGHKRSRKNKRTHRDIRKMVYDNYVEYCTHLGTQPLTQEQWTINGTAGPVNPASNVKVVRRGERSSRKKRPITTIYQGGLPQ